jgi:hypothetical protein
MLGRLRMISSRPKDRMRCERNIIDTRVLVRDGPGHIIPHPLRRILLGNDLHAWDCYVDFLSLA